MKALTESQITALITKHRNDLTEVVTRCFYEDEWQETRVNADAVRRLILDVVVTLSA